MERTEISNILLTKVLPRIIPLYTTADYAPFIIGGTAVTRCMSMYDETRVLLHNVFNKDIDIDFIMFNSDDKTIKKANAAHAKFIKDIVASKEIQEFDKNHPEFTMRVSEIFIPHKPSLKVKKLQLVYDKVHIDAIDVVMYNQYDQQNFYKTFFKTKYPILRQTDNNMLYASCEWIFYETVRMMYVYDNYLSSAVEDMPNLPSRKHVFKKLVRYVLKFCALYVVMHEGEGFDQYKHVYNHVKQLLVGALERRSFLNSPLPDIQKQEQKYLHDIIQKILKKKELHKFKKHLEKLCRNNDCL